MGNIGGNILANRLRETGMSWMWNFRTIGIIVGVIGIINFFLLIDHPAKVHIIIDPPENEKDQLIESRNKASSIRSAKSKYSFHLSKIR